MIPWILVAGALSFAIAFLVSEGAFKEHLSPAGRVVIPIFLGLVAWSIWLVVQFIRGTL